MDLKELKKKALAVKQHYDELSIKRYGRAWTKEELTLGLVGDIGDLAKLVLAENGVRTIPGSKEKLGHELADCLWSLLVLAELCEVDLEKEYLKTMETLSQLEEC